MTEKTENNAHPTPADQDAKTTQETETTPSPDKETELTQALQRLQAEFENFKKRSEKEKQIFMQFANKGLFADIIPVLDNFERALQATQDEGVKMIHAQLLEALKKHGLETIEEQTGKFDPKVHEAMLQEPSDKEPGTILETLQKGYKVKDTVIRPARVKIAKQKEETNEAQSVQRGGDQ